MNEQENLARQTSPVFQQIGHVSPPEKTAYIFHLLLAGVVAIVLTAVWQERGASGDVFGATMFLLFAWFATPTLGLLVVAFIYSVKAVKASDEIPLPVLLVLIIGALAALMIGTEASTLLFMVFGSMYVVGTVACAILWFSKHRKRERSNLA